MFEMALSILILWLIAWPELQTECLCPPQIHMLKTTPHVVGPLGGDWVMRVKLSWMELVLLKKRHQEAPWLFFFFCHVRHCDKMDLYELGSSLSSDTEYACILISDFPASRTARNKILLFISQLIYGTLLRTKTTGYRILGWKWVHLK